MSMIKKILIGIAIVCALCLLVPISWVVAAGTGDEDCDVLESYVKQGYKVTLRASCIEHYIPADCRVEEEYVKQGLKEHLRTSCINHP